MIRVQIDRHLRFRLYVSGGRTDLERWAPTASMEMLDLRGANPKWKLCAPMHEKRCDHAMIAFNNQLFVFGGINLVELESCEKLVIHRCLFKDALGNWVNSARE